MTKRAFLLATVLLAVVACNKTSNKAAGKAADAAGSEATQDTGDIGGGAEPPGQGVAGCPRELAGASVDKSYTITRDCGPVRVSGEFYLDNGTLTLEAGATLVFAENALLGIGYNQPAKLITRGTAEAPVTFTTSADKVPGAWKGVRLFAHARRSTLEGLVIELAGGEDEGAVQVDATGVVIRGSTVRSSKGSGLWLTREAQAEVAGTTFEEIGKAAIRTTPGGVTFGEGNAFPAGATIQVEHGQLDRSAVWPAQGATYVIVDDLMIDAEGGSETTLKIAPGVQVKLGPGVEIGVGYHAASALEAVGTREAPILFTGEDWDSIRVYSFGHAALVHAIVEGSVSAEGAMVVDGRAAIEDSIFRNDEIGVYIAGNARLAANALDRNRFESVKKAAIRLQYIRHLEAVGAGNVFGEQARIVTGGGDVKEATTWHALAAPIEVTEDVNVMEKAVVTIEPGARFEMNDGITLAIGYGGPSSIHAAGTAAKPITFAGVRDEAGVWGGIRVYATARDVSLEHVVLRNVRHDQASIHVDADAVVKLSNVACARCEAPAVVTWACDAKVTLSDIQALEGTREPQARPEGCE